MYYLCALLGDESSHGTLTSVKTTLMQEWDGLRTTKDRCAIALTLTVYSIYIDCWILISIVLFDCNMPTGWW